LGAVWLELATLAPSKNSKGSRKKMPDQVAQRNTKTQLELAFADDEILTRYVKNLTHQQSGVQIQELLNWALQKNWNPQRFFQAFQSAVSKNQIQERQGTLISI
jgi:hypothetical protein